VSRTLTVLSAAKDPARNGVVLAVKRSEGKGTHKLEFGPISRVIDCLVVTMGVEEIDEVVFTPRAVRNLNDLLVYAKFEVIK
jgi:hypothetical protein